MADEVTTSSPLIAETAEAPAAPSPALPAYPAPFVPEQKPPHQSFWLWVMCLTGVDYFSTLGYQPSIAFEATGRLSPLATVFLVAVTLFGAVPVYRYVAGVSPHGQGSIALLERLVSGWGGKLTVLVLLGFAGTAFIITKTLSAADAAEHVVHNPLWRGLGVPLLDDQMLITMGMLVVLGGMFLRGFREIIGLAVVIVALYLSLNLLLIAACASYLLQHPEVVSGWWQAVVAGDWALAERPIAGHGWGTIVLLCLLLFPKLALGLSGFETGVAVMPLVRGRGENPDERLADRIRGTRRLLLTAALIMSFYLLASSLITATLIEPDELAAGGRAANRALAYLAHGEATREISPLFGDTFGTVYDFSTVVILWFAGASAMAGLLNLLPQYLPRYGMAPEWAAAVRPLVLLLTGINLLVTWLFDANVLAQGPAYATGVLALILSAAVGALVDSWQRRRGPWWRRPWGFLLVTLLFVYTTGAIMVEKPAGIQIAACFVGAILVSSFVSRTLRSTELRFMGFQYIDDRSRFLWDSMRHIEFPVLVPHRPGRRDLALKEQRIRERHRLGPDIPLVFMEIERGDPSEFYQSPMLEVIEEQGRFILRITHCASIAHAIAAVALELSKVGRPPEIHFGWSDESPLSATVGFVLFGEGNVPWMVRELIRRAEPDADRRPPVIIG